MRLKIYSVSLGLRSLGLTVRRSQNFFIVFYLPAFNPFIQTPFWVIRCYPVLSQSLVCFLSDTIKLAHRHF